MTQLIHREAKYMPAAALGQAAMMRGLDGDEEGAYDVEYMADDVMQ